VRQLWEKEAPELDTSPIAVIARLGRAHAYVDRALHAVFAQYGLTRQSFDVLASLRRIGREHLANERGMLAPLTPEEQATLAALLRRLLIAFEGGQP
jgi:DNA-binding MarR family transcriptional regulator